MSLRRLVVVLTLVSATYAATIPLHGAAPAACDPNTGIGCLPSPDDCPEGCVCNRTSAVMNDTDTEVLRRPSERVEYRMVRTITNYGVAGVSDENELGMEDSLATKLNEKVKYVFRGILLSATLFIVCACVCVVTVCVYCCHIRQADRKLKREVDALAKKLQVDMSKKPGSSRKKIEPKGESCNVVVQDANVLCV